jgi:hypothetical protein
MRLDMTLLSNRSSATDRRDEESKSLNLSDIAIPGDAVQPPPRHTEDRGDERSEGGGLNIVV